MATLEKNRLIFLIHLSPLLLFYTPCKSKKKKGFVVSPGGIKSELSEEVGEIINYLC